MKKRLSFPALPRGHSATVLNAWDPPPDPDLGPSPAIIRMPIAQAIVAAEIQNPPTCPVYVSVV